MRAWEYRLEKLTFEDNMHAALDALGADGWELVHIMTVTEQTLPTVIRTSIVFFLKRERAPAS